RAPVRGPAAGGGRPRPRGRGHAGPPPGCRGAARRGRTDPGRRGAPAAGAGRGGRGTPGARPQPAGPARCVAGPPGARPHRRGGAPDRAPRPGRGPRRRPSHATAAASRRSGARRRPPGPAHGHHRLPRGRVLGFTPMPPYRTLLFDLDGTLIDSIGLIVDSYHHTMAAHGLPPLPDEYWTRGTGTPLRVQLAPFVSEQLPVEVLIAT